MDVTHIENSWKMKKRILCLNSEIFSPLYLDLFKNDNGNCFFSNLRFLRFLHNFFLERKREMPSSIFYIVLTSWSNFLWIDDFFSFHNGAKKNLHFNWEILRRPQNVNGTKGQTKSKRFFSSRCFLGKTNEGILLYYHETSGGFVFVRFFLRKLKTPTKLTDFYNI